MATTTYDGSIDSLKAILSNRRGIARANRFSVTMTPPAGIMTPTDVRDISVLCESSVIPSRKIKTFEYATYRQEMKYPAGFNHDDIDLSFILTGDYFIKNVMDAWLDLIVDHSSYRIQYQAKFAGTLLITQLDEALQEVYTLKLENAWPTSLGAIQLDANGGDTFHTLPVTFTYEAYEIISASSPSIKVVHK